MTDQVQRYQPNIQHVECYPTDYSTGKKGSVINSEPATDEYGAVVRVAGQIASLTTWQSSQWAVGTSATPIASPALSGRKSISLKASVSGADAICIGSTAAITTSNGYELNDRETIDLDLDENATIWAIVTSGTHTLFVVEVA